MFFCTEKWAFSEHKTLYLRISPAAHPAGWVALTGEEGVARQHQAHQVALGAAAGEDAGVARRKTDPGAQPFDQLHLDNGCRRALIESMLWLVALISTSAAANHRARAVQVRHALRVMHRQAVFQEVLDRTINRRTVTQTLFVKF